MFSRMMAKWALGRSAKAERRLREAVCQPLEERLLLSKTIYVDVNSPAPATNGPTWGTAYRDLQLALAAAVSGDTIKVADGTYKPTTGTTRTFSFVLKTGVGIYGGYAGYGAVTPDARNVAGTPSVLSGDIGTVGTAADNSYHVVTGGGTNATAVLDGFTITAGNANATNSPNNLGGGIYNSGGSPTINSCTFTSNSAVSGGGMCNTSSSPTVSNCTFSTNAATSNGAGIYNSTSSSPTIDNCTFSGNTSSSVGGGIYDISSSPAINNCTFSGNTATFAGGGMMNSSSSSPTITNCTFVRNGNASTYYGGGFHNESSSTILINCAFYGNTAQNGSGACTTSSGLTLTNCAFAGNVATGAGGGVYCFGSVTLTNCTIAGNVSGTGGGVFGVVSPSVLTNCILWGNCAVDGGQISQQNITCSVTYSNVQGTWTGNGNIDVDPLFVRNPSTGNDGTWGTIDDDYGDLRLAACSPAADTGKNAAVPSGVNTDLVGNARFSDIPTTVDTGVGIAPIVDMGAYEAVPVLAASAGGPYVVVQGQGISLHAYGASTATGTLQFAWDLNGDGQFDDATGSTANFSTSGHGVGTFVVRARVTDSAARNIVGSSTITIVPVITYVDAHATGANNGTSWANARTNLGAALMQAPAGQEVRVAQGTYRPTTGTGRFASFQLNSGVSVIGAYAGSGAPDPNVRDACLFPSILSGDIGIESDNSDNSCHVIVANGAGATALLDGFQIVGGNASGGGYANFYGGGILNEGASLKVIGCTFSGNAAMYGAGLYNTSSSLVLTGCTFSGNTASSGGGGAFNNSASPLISNCTFSGNSASNDGGGLGNATSAPILSGCTFTGNSADRGGGVFNSGLAPTFTNCVFTANLASGYGGGGMYNSGSSPMLTGCTFTGNSVSKTSNGGGGIYSDGGGAQVLTNCTFLRNVTFVDSDGQSWGIGGAMYVDYGDVTLTGCVIAGNKAAAAGAIYIDTLYHPASVSAINCVLVGNSAGSQGGAAYGGERASLINCTIVANVAGRDTGGVAGGFIYTNNNCILWNNTAPKNSDFGADPLFVRSPYPGADGAWGTVDDDYGDLHLQACSPMADAGKNALLPGNITTDISGNSRFRDIPTTPDTGVGVAPIIDIGAYEAIPALAANAGGTYYVIAGKSVTLSGHGASTISGTLQYAWEWSGDGKFDEATGAAPVFSTAGLPYVSTVSIFLRVTDAASRTIVATTALKVLPPIIYVDGDAKGNGDGTSWANAVTSLAMALLQAMPGQRLQVADGTYKPTDGADRKATFQLKNGVSILGGYAGYGAANPDMRDVTLNPTVLSGDIGVVGSNGDNSYHVVDARGADSSAILDGVTVTAGNANGPGTNSYGGGMYLLSSSATINNCRFLKNIAAADGGGLYTDQGGDYYNPITNCQFNGNTATNGGGICSVSSHRLVNCTFVGNTAACGGGAYDAAYLTNCTVVANTATTSGGGLYYYYITGSLGNCIVWANTGSGFAGIYQTGGTTAMYSDIHGDRGVGGTNNINADPLFVRNPSAGTDGKWGTVDDDYGDLRPQLTSPVIDAGNNAAVPAGIATDPAGKPRFLDVPGVADTGLGTAPIVDMGAYERGLVLTTTGTSASEQFSVGLTLDRATLQISGGASLSAASVHSYAVNTVESCEFVTGGGDDTLTVDVTYGLPAIGLSCTAGDGKDALVLTGTTSGQSVQVMPGQVLLGTAAVTYTNVEAVQLDGTAGGVVDVGALTVGTNLAVTAGKNMVLRTGALSITAGGTLDLAGNGMILNYTGSAPVQAVNRWLLNGRIGVTPGLKTSGSVFSGTGALGMVDNALVHLSSFAGQALGGVFSQLLVEPTVAGDANLDGVVDSADYLAVVANMGKTNSQWFMGDLNCDGIVSADDFAEVTAHLTNRVAIAAGPMVADESGGGTSSRDQGFKSSRGQEVKALKKVQGGKAGKSKVRKVKGKKVKGIM